jgi:glycosyltransferase involved in cell wall biosynthesis
MLIHDNVVTTRNSIERIHEYGDHPDSELFLIFNGVGERMRSVVMENIPEFVFCKNVNIIDNKENIGVIARNQAIDQCSGDYIVFIDNDVYVQPGFLIKLERFFQYAGVGFVSAHGWRARVISDEFQLYKDDKLEKGSAIDVGSCSLAMYSIDNRNLLKLPVTFLQYGSDDIYISFRLLEHGYSGILSTWNNIAIHVGQAYGGINCGKLYESNYSITKREFMPKVNLLKFGGKE